MKSQLSPSVQIIDTQTSGKQEVRDSTLFVPANCGAMYVGVQGEFLRTHESQMAQVRQAICERFVCELLLDGKVQAQGLLQPSVDRASVSTASNWGAQLSADGFLPGDETTLIARLMQDGQEVARYAMNIRFVESVAMA